MADSTRASGAKKTAAKKTAAKPATRKSTAKKSTAKKATPKKATPKKANQKAAARTPAKVSSVAAAADRAGGERARRRTTPLLTGPSAEVPTTTSSKGGSRTSSTSSRPAKPKKPSAPRQPRLTVVPGPDGAPPAATPTARRRPPARRSTSTASRPAARSTAAASRRPVSPAVAPAQPVATPGTPDSGQALVPGLAELLSVLLSAGQLTSRTLGQAAGAAAGEDWERRFAETLQFLQRRVKGDYAVDDFGFDRDFTTHTVFPVLRLLKDKWFRVEVRGIENIPADSGALLVSNHSGTVAIDSVITQLAIHDAHPQQRFLRMLGADLVFQLPVVGDVARKTGATLASNADAERLLRGGELVGVWPEGFKGVGKPFRERYKLQRFGRGGFVSAAIRSEVPIIPCSVVGAEEVYPMIGNMKTVARLLGAPYAPITPFFPLLGPLGLIPLPSKWIIEFGEPVDTASLGPAAAEDPMLVFELTDQVRETIQQTLYSVLVTRRSVFF
ncbi:lysophospholipid acyltransferase family protein [Janibacter indicus]|uniref:1-acyl-sn-glycerol-3-phosphate acyltransferase n=1 Tax=Janibacter indicus TaxID=857417 RepID=A0A1W2CRC2_9MICO|nr:lysophospholipid acyltransferase family protein [Janibacter indicus]SMC87780.1 1-acyl-sn-glycerol-3-phosphate acyltransferase [Janibacter indicus]